MTRVKISLLLLVPALALASGCWGPKKPKPNPAIAGELEEGFQERWIQKRVADLRAANAALDEETARNQAAGEFAERYRYLRGAK